MWNPSQLSQQLRILTEEEVEKIAKEEQLSKPLQKSYIQNIWVKPLCCQNFTMTLLTSWISVLMAFLLLLHFWRAKAYASGNSEEEIDFTYVIIGVTLGLFLAISFVAVIICMIKKQMIDNVFGESDGKMDRRDDINVLGKQSTNDQ
ncbi:hypothetical protein QYF61_001812 [Mycteria americana]|uniref:Transmembrane protein n=1 Tax=Mycteria americana TaxID=33587 RepID=A0AAN7N6J6_MYCAM|nr:hypothetical protein QYF61_001812 [Mycteria americana]